MISLLIASVLALASARRSFVVNDMDAEGLEGHGWESGYYSPCIGYGTGSEGAGHAVDYHTDGAGSRGEVSVAVTAPLESAGCYLVEEWHPSGRSCSPYLPKNAPLQVNTVATTEHLVVDQSVNGGQWNKLGLFSLLAEGPHLSFSNGGGGGLQCEASICWWTADAWRFTEQPAEMCGEAPVAAPIEEYAEIPESVTHSDCEEFGEELLELLDRCNGATQCSAPEFAQFEHPCRVDAAAFAAKYEFKTARCLMSCMREKSELKASGHEVEAILACPESNAANEEAAWLGSYLEELEKKHVSLRGEGEHHTLTKVTEPNPHHTFTVAEASEAMEFDGDCSQFKKFAEQVVDHCQSARCCADVVEDDKCRYYAAGLHSLFPSNAINYCVRQVKLERQCSCFVRKVSSCAVQAEVHEILYDEKWAPTCSKWPPMLKQQDLAESGGAEESSSWMKLFLLPLVAVVAGVLFISTFYKALCRASDKVDDLDGAEEGEIPTGREVSEEEDGPDVKDGTPVGTILVVDGVRAEDMVVIARS